MPKNYNPEHIELNFDGKLIEMRKGVKNRNEPDRIDFRLEKAYQKAIIGLK